MTPIILVFGQSNASYLFQSKALQDQLSVLGSDAQVIGVSAGGQSVAQHDGGWNITTGDGTDTPGHLYVELLDTMSSVRAETPDAYIAGAVWVQSEADTQTGLIGEYYAPAEELFTQMRVDLDEDFPITIVQQSDYQDTNDIARAYIQEAQAQLAEDLPDVTLINTDAVIEENGLRSDQVMRDSLHFSDSFLDLLAGEILEQPELMITLGLQADTSSNEADPAQDQPIVQLPLEEEESAVAQMVVEEVTEEIPIQTSAEENKPNAEPDEVQAAVLSSFEEADLDIKSVGGSVAVEEFNVGPDKVQEVVEDVVEQVAIEEPNIKVEVTFPDNLTIETSDEDPVDNVAKAPSSQKITSNETGDSPAVAIASENILRSDETFDQPEESDESVLPSGAIISVATLGAMLTAGAGVLMMGLGLVAALLSGLGGDKSSTEENTFDTLADAEGTVSLGEIIPATEVLTESITHDVDWDDMSEVEALG